MKSILANKRSAVWFHARQLIYHICIQNTISFIEKGSPETRTALICIALLQNPGILLGQCRHFMLSSYLIDPNRDDKEAADQYELIVCVDIEQV